MTPALETRALAVGYRGRPAILSNIDLAAEPGEIICLLGPNGIGKSTLMRTLAHMQPALAGQVLIGGSDISLMPRTELAKKVAVVLTERLSIGAMPAFRLVELGRYPHSNWSGLLSERDRDIVQRAIEAVGAQHLAHRDINELSDGERQRIMIARALAQQPAVLLLDEPAAFLDVSARVEMMAVLRRLARQQQVAVVLSSHDLELSLRSADTIWLIDGARRLYIGAPEDLLADGSIAAAFSTPHIAFSARDRSFRLLTPPHASAHVDGPSAALARTVLEREGFAIAPTPAEAQLSVTADGTAWQAQSPHGHGRGKSFAELARFTRQYAETAIPLQPDRQK